MIGKNEHDDGDGNQKILQKPIPAIDGTDREENPENRIAARENLEKPVIGELRLRGIHRLRLFRSVSATRAIIMIAPIAAASISFCASHSSPCPPSQSTPFPGATSSATML